MDGITRRIGTWRYETDPYEEQDEESGNWTWETLKKQEIDGRKRRLRKICCIALSLILCIALIFAVHFIKGDFSFAAWRMKEIIVGPNMYQSLHVSQISQTN